jgi:hypothetical protein
MNTDLRNRQLEALGMAESIAMRLRDIWDAVAGCYYDPNTDLYLTLEQFNAMAGLN